MRQFLRFFFSPKDQVRLELLVAVSEVTSLNTLPTEVLANFQSLKLTFQVTDPHNGAPQIRPLLPGLLRFLVDQAALPHLPAPDETFQQNYPKWNETNMTRGTLAVELVSPPQKKELASELEELFLTHLGVRMNRVWFSMVRLTDTFLFQTLGARGFPTPFSDTDSLAPRQPVSLFRATPDLLAFERRFQCQTPPTTC